MIPQNWTGLLLIEEIKHYDANNNLLYEQYQIPNTLHLEGEQFILGALFIGGPLTNPFIPTNYFFGLDNRQIVSRSDTLAIIGALEPRINGYARQPVSSTNGFVTSFDNDLAAYKATSGIVTFRGVGGPSGSVVWGPVQNLFMTDRDLSSNAGTLIATAALDNPITVRSGDAVSMRMSLVIRGATV